MKQDQDLFLNQRKFQQKSISSLKYKSNNPLIEVQNQKIIHSNRIGFKHVTCKLGNGKQITFQTAYIEKQQHLNVHGVQVIPILHYPNKKPQIILIANYRPPVDKFVLQFPGGYTQSNSYQEQARRQALQQIGYDIKHFQNIPTPIMYSDPWRSNESIHMFVGRINGEDRSLNVGQNLQQGENIRVYKLPIDDNLLKNINQLAKKNDYIIQKNVWTVSLGILMKDLLK